MPPNLVGASPVLGTDDHDIGAQRQAGLAGVVAEPRPHRALAGPAGR